MRDEDMERVMDTQTGITTGVGILFSSRLALFSCVVPFSFVKCVKHRVSISLTFGHDFQQVIIMFGYMTLLLVDLKIIHAFAVPTGSMSPTIMGYHKEAACPQCGARFFINA